MGMIDSYSLTLVMIYNSEYTVRILAALSRKAKLIFMVTVPSTPQNSTIYPVCNMLIWCYQILWAEQQHDGP